MNKRRRLWIYGGIVIAAGVGLVVVANASDVATPVTVPPTPSVPPVQSKNRIVPGHSRVLLIGDSLAVGLTAPMKALASDDGVAFSAHGIVGSRIADWSSLLVVGQKDLAVKPTIVLVSLGTNDEKMLVPTQEKSALAKLIATLRATGADIVWIAPPSMPFPDRGVPQMISATGVSVYPSATLSIPRGPDQIHPTAKGYAGWAGAIWKWIG